MPGTRHDAHFNDQTAKLLGDAFDIACADLHRTPYANTIREIIANRMIFIELTSGECDPHELAKHTLESLGMVK